MTKTEAAISLSLVGCGLGMILAANLFRTSEHPHPFYHPVLFGHLGWKREWWTRPGYILQRTGPILMNAGFLLMAILYISRWD